jgi:phospholipase/carboxylesterase
MMALDAMATGRWSCAGIVAFSGRLASPPPLTPVLDTPVLLVHGSADPVIPPAETVEAAAKLAPLGVKVESHVLARLGHTVSREGALMAARFLADRLNGSTRR